MTPAIETEALSRVFKARRGTKEVIALRDVNLTVPQGEFFGLLGPNGAGKTTLIKILTTLLLPSDGTARVLGFDVANQFSDLRWHISMVSGGETSGYGLLTIREQLWMFSQFHGLDTKEARTRIDDLLEVVGLSEWADTRIYNLSTGMRQKMNVVRGLISDPKVFFLDEPTLGLDVEIARDVRTYLKTWMAEGEGDRTILLTTHYMAEADELCDRIAIIDQGRIVRLGTGDDLKHQARFKERYRLEFDGEADAGSLFRFGAVEIVAGPEGDSAIVSLDEAGDGPELIKAAAALTRLRSFTREEPSLEDAFIALTGHAFEEASEPGEPVASASDLPER